MMSALLVSGLAQGQAVSLADEYQKKIKAATEISALGSGMFGETVSEATGKTVFAVVDIDLPGNNVLPVRFGRRLPIDERYVSEELGGLGNWDIDVPYIEGTFSKYHGWTVPAAHTADRTKRCSMPGWPAVEGQIFMPNEVFHGYNIRVPGVYEGQMLAEANTYVDPADGVSYPWILESMARLSCLPTLKNGVAGEGFVLKLPDGTRYFFDHAVERALPTLRKAQKTVPGYSMERKRVFLLATRIEDRFGNVVDYQYTGGRLTGIVASDGRRITLQSNQAAGTITATANGRVWTYTLQNGHLATVQNPDGSKWTYSPFGFFTPRPDHPEDGIEIEFFSPENFCLDQNSPYSQGGEFAFNVVHPSGAAARFDFVGQHFYRSYVPYRCVIDFLDHQVRIFSGLNMISNGGDWTASVTSIWGMTLDQQNAASMLQNVSGVAHIAEPNYIGVYSLKKQTLTGAGLSSQVTLYDYQSEAFPYCDQIDSSTGVYVGVRCHQDPCPDAACTDSVGRWVTITLPTGDKVRKRFGVIYGQNEGRLLQEQVVDAAGTVVREIEHRHFDDTTATGQAFAKRIGWSFTPDPIQGQQRPWLSTEVRQEGVTYRTEVLRCSGAIYCFDAFARPTRVRKSNSLGWSRTETTEYHDNLALWVLGQVARVTVDDAGPNGLGGVMVPMETGYNAQALPAWSKRFGRLQQSMTYHADGTLATVTDARGYVTTATDWKRGIPQTIRHPPTDEAPAGAVESATVDDNGWITSVTDESGAKTCYGHDGMGRIASVLHPSETQPGVCDTSAWNPVAMTFEKIAAAAYGLAPGHWRAARSEGDLRVNVYYDALWRPVLEERYDHGNPADTRSQVVKRYDSAGRLRFQSYPVRGVTDAASVVDGMRSFHDALDRLVRSEQDSELGVLATTTEYLPGLQMRTTNPRGHQVTTGFMAWDAPGYDLPLWSVQPEGKVIELTRHPQFGWPLQLKQRNAAGTLQATRRYVYDAGGLLCKAIEPETGATVMEYDATGNPVGSAAGLDLPDPLSCDRDHASVAERRVSRAYDPRNRLTTLVFPDGRGNQVWTYTADSLPASITTWNGPGGTQPVVNAYSYNRRRLMNGQGDSISQPGWYAWGLGYGYDRNGQLATLRYPTGLIVDYAPNALGQATVVRNAQQPAVVYASGIQYHPNGAIQRFTYGNGLVHTMTQNARQLPARVTSTGNALDFAYAYDRNGNPVQIDDHVTGLPTSQHRTLTYDALDRLTTAVSPALGGSDHTHRFGYDALDNLTSWTQAGVKDYAQYLYDARNRLTSIRNSSGATVVGLEYDPQGNLRNKNGQQFHFDLGNRLRGVSSGETYLYDGLGRRVQTIQANGDTRLWQYSHGGQLLFAWSGPGNQKTHEYIYLAGSLLATIDHHWPSNLIIATRYQHTDALGSPVALSDELGAVVERHVYEPWGAIVGKPAYSGIGYTGHVMDGGTGLTYMQQRYYDQSIGRFLSVDPVSVMTQ